MSTELVATFKTKPEAQAFVKGINHREKKKFRIVKAKPYNVKGENGEYTWSPDWRFLFSLHTLIMGAWCPVPIFEDGASWIAWDGEEPVGFCHVSEAVSTKGYGYLARAAVLANYRGYGLQQRFLRKRETYAKRQGWLGLVSDTTDNQHSANNLIKAGYRMFEPDNPWGFETTLYWRKDF